MQNSQSKTTHYSLLTANSTLTSWQAYVLVSMSAMLGFTLSYGHLSGSWLLSQVICAAISFGSIFLMIYIFRKGEYAGIIEAVYSCLGEPAARILFFLMGIYFAVQAAFALSYQAEMTDLFLLETTPTDVEILVLAFTAAILFSHGIRRLAKTAEMLVWLVILPVLPLLIVSMISIEPMELLCVFRPKLTEMPASMLSCSVSLWGFESLLFFLGKDKLSPKAKKHIYLGAGTAILITVLGFITIVGTLTMGGASQIRFPMNELSRMVNIGGTTRTMRFDIIFVFVRMITILISVSIAMYSASISLCGALKIERFRCFVYILAPLVATMAFFSRIHPITPILDSVCRFGYISISIGIVPVLAAITAFKSMHSSQCTIHN